MRTRPGLSHELESALEHTLDNKDDDYILSIRLDDTEIPGLRSTIEYVPISVGIPQISKMVLEKLEARGLIHIPERREAPDSVLGSVLSQMLDDARVMLTTDPVGALLKSLRIASEYTRMGQSPLRRS